MRYKDLLDQLLKLDESQLEQTAKIFHVDSESLDAWITPLRLFIKTSETNNQRYLAEEGNAHQAKIGDLFLSMEKARDLKKRGIQECPAPTTKRCIVVT